VATLLYPASDDKQRPVSSWFHVTCLKYFV